MGTALSCLCCSLSKSQLEYHSCAVPVPLCRMEKLLEDILTDSFLCCLESDV